MKPAGNRADGRGLKPRIQVLAGLYIILVRIGPMELDLLALAGDGVDAGFVDSPGEEIALGVVSAEEAKYTA